MYGVVSMSVHDGRCMCVCISILQIYAANKQTNFQIPCRFSHFARSVLCGYGWGVWRRARSNQITRNNKNISKRLGDHCVFGVNTRRISCEMCAASHSVGSLIRLARQIGVELECSFYPELSLQPPARPLEICALIRYKQIECRTMTHPHHIRAI